VLVRSEPAEAGIGAAACVQVELAFFVVVATDVRALVLDARVERVVGRVAALEIGLAGDDARAVVLARIAMRLNVPRCSDAFAIGRAARVLALAVLIARVEERAVRVQSARRLAGAVVSVASVAVRAIRILCTLHALAARAVLATAIGVGVALELARAVVARVVRRVARGLNRTLFLVLNARFRLDAAVGALVFELGAERARRSFDRAAVARLRALDDLAFLRRRRNVELARYARADRLAGKRELLHPRKPKAVMRRTVSKSDPYIKVVFFIFGFLLEELKGLASRRWLVF